MHQGADEGHDHHHDGGKIVNGETEDNLERSDSRCSVQVHPCEVDLQGLGVESREFLQHDHDGRRKCRGHDGRLKPVPLPRKFLAEEHHQHETGERQCEDDERESKQCVRRHKHQRSVVRSQWSGFGIQPRGPLFLQ